MTQTQSNEPFREIDFADWHNDMELERQFEFEGTNCDCCGDAVGGHLDGDDRPVFDTIWLTADEQTLCEDCFMEFLEEQDRDEIRRMIWSMVKVVLWLATAIAIPLIFKDYAIFALTVFTVATCARFWRDA